MISALRRIESAGTRPYDNLALERYLTLHAQEGECILFLWQNRHTVVIGRNQNAWEECRVNAFREEGGKLARRLSGGGAVYHDLGNLNYTFAAKKADFDPEKQTCVILRAVRKLGVPAERTGRNDLEAEGRKCSGNAYYEQSGCCCHHGTLMMRVDLERMERALSVPAAKLRSKAVSSVRARVANLDRYCPGLTRGQLSGAIVEAFEETYGLPAGKLEPERIDGEEIRRGAEFFSSEEWILGRRISFASQMEERFPWGGVRLELSADRGRVKEAACWSDAMEERLIREIGEGMAGCPYDGKAMAERVAALAAKGPADPETAAVRRLMASDIARMIREQTDGIRE